MSNPSSSSRSLPTSLHVDRLLRACVHCGFCNAACPTYRLSGDERDSPRGRLHLMKGLLAGEDGVDLEPLERCLSCRACETACPAGVQYTEILDYVREHTNDWRPWRARMADRLLWQTLGSRGTMRTLLGLLRTVRTVLPARWVGGIRGRKGHLAWPDVRHERKVGLLQGCIQPHMAPDLGTKAAIVLDRCEISAIPLGPACCGSLAHRLHQTVQARQLASERLADWQPDWIGITSTATGCTAFLAEYPRLMPDLAKSRPFADKVADIAAFIEPEKLPLLPAAQRLKIAFHAPCSLQNPLHGADRVESILRAIGHDLVKVDGLALCCGSAGPYSLRHPRWSRALAEEKWRALTQYEPEQVITANIGCLRQLAAAADRPVRHWIDLVYDAVTSGCKDDPD